VASGNRAGDTTGERLERPARGAQDRERERDDESQPDTDRECGERFSPEPQPSIAIGQGLRGQEVRDRR
jgi:hypothetical protein